MLKFVNIISMKKIQTYLIVVSISLVLASCSTADGNFGGSEYVPDMVHSLAYDANVYSVYDLNSWDAESTIRRKDLSNLHNPVAGTIPRGYAGMEFSANSPTMYKKLRGQTQINEMPVPLNGSAPFYYKDTNEDRARAATEIIANPFPITDAGLEKGKKLFNIDCAICHGKKGNGLGYLVDDEANPLAKFPAQPANFMTDRFIEATNGQFYYTIMYGKGMMGSFKDKLSYEERWQVIHYIRSLQAKKKGLEYNEKINTLDSTAGVPLAKFSLTNIQQLAPVMEMKQEGASAAESMHHEH